MLNLDTTGLEALETIHARLAKGGGVMMLCCMPPQVSSLLARSSFDKKLGADYLFESFDEALRQASTSS